MFNLTVVLPFSSKKITTYFDEVFSNYSFYWTDLDSFLCTSLISNQLSVFGNFLFFPKGLNVSTFFTFVYCLFSLSTHLDILSLSHL